MFDKSPVVKGALAKEYADKYYEIEDDIFPIFEKLDTPLLDTLIKPGMHVMDAMMGRGRHAIRYAKRGCTVWGNDLNQHMVAIARKGAKIAHVPKGKIRFSVLDACTLNGVPKNHFDATFAMFSAVGTVPGSKNRSKAIASFARVTKPGGIVIVHAHNRLDCWHKPDWFSWIFKSTLRPDKGLETGDMVTDYNGLADMFNHFYTPAELRRDFRRAGLDVVEEHYHAYDPPHTLRGPLKRLRADGFVFVGRRPKKKL
jgi:ubiquinone/menaquinone biosynthesis C-methylase UbiE